MASANDIPNLAVEVKNRLEVSPQSAFSWIQSLGSPSEVCDVYNKAVKDLYWLEKGSKSLVLIGKSGTSYCLSESKKHENVHSQISDEFKAQAKTIAYNVAVNTWPGWGDEGVVISKSDTEAGLDAALMNLKLAFELKKPADKVAAAYWLLSALQLSLEKYQDSMSSIDLSNSFAMESKDHTVLHYGEGFKGLILLASGNLIDGTRLFESAVDKLKSLGTEDATSYINQLTTAKKIFVK